jgi:hypothetical protein
VRTPLKALIVCTLSSLVATLTVTVGVGTYWWVWAIWSVLAVGAVALVVEDRRRHA